MVTWSFFRSWLFVYIAVSAGFSQRVCGHDMIQSPAEVASECIWGSVIPECVLVWLLAVHSEYIDKSPLCRLFEAVTDFGVKTDMPTNKSRLIASPNNEPSASVYSATSGANWMIKGK